MNRPRLALALAAGLAGLAGPALPQLVTLTNVPYTPPKVDSGSDGAAIRQQVLRPGQEPAGGRVVLTNRLRVLTSTNWTAARSATNAVPTLPYAGKPDVIRAANFIYAGSKSSVCFSGKFLSSLARESHIETDPAFTPVQLATDGIFAFPFAVMTGEGAFAMPEQERRNLAAYLKRGGFLLASAGCSSPEWDRSFRAELAKAMPDARLKKLPMTHPLFSTLYKIASIQLKHNGTTQLEALELDGRVVLIYSPEGLNDTSSVSGCCCCGGNEVRNSHEINVNIFAYAIMH